MNETVSEPVPGIVPSGDPTLGPNDAALQIELLLLGRGGIVAHEETSLRLSNAFTPAASEAVATAIQSSVELVRQGAITQMSEAILSRCPPLKGQVSPGCAGSSQNRDPSSVPGEPLGSSEREDPSLGPNDLRLKVKLLLIGQREILCQDAAETRLSRALTLMARGATAAVIDTSTEVLVRNALGQIRQLMEKRFPKKEVRADEVDSELAHLPPLETDDYPEVLPPPPAKKSSTS